MTTHLYVDGVPYSITSGLASELVARILEVYWQPCPRRPYGLTVREIWSIRLYLLLLSTRISMRCAYRLDRLLTACVMMTSAARAFLLVDEAAIQGLLLRLEQYAYAITPAETAFMGQFSFCDDVERHARTDIVLAPYGLQVPIWYRF